MRIKEIPYKLVLLGPDHMNDDDDDDDEDDDDDNSRPSDGSDDGSYRRKGKEEKEGKIRSKGQRGKKHEAVIMPISECLQALGTLGLPMVPAEFRLVVNKHAVKKRDREHERERDRDGGRSGSRGTYQNG